MRGVLALLAVAAAAARAEAQESFWIDDAVKRGYVSVRGTGQANRLGLVFHRPCTVHIPAGTVFKGSQAQSVAVNTTVRAPYVTADASTVAACTSGTANAVATVGTTAANGAVATAQVDALCLEADQAVPEAGRELSTLTAMPAHVAKANSISTAIGRATVAQGDKLTQGLNIPAGVNEAKLVSDAAQWTQWRLNNEIEGARAARAPKKDVSQAVVAAAIAQEFAAATGRPPDANEQKAIDAKAAAVWTITERLTTATKGQM